MSDILDVSTQTPQLLLSFSFIQSSKDFCLPTIKHRRHAAQKTKTQTKQRRTRKTERKQQTSLCESHYIIFYSIKILHCVYSTCLTYRLRRYTVVATLLIVGRA